MPKPAVRTLILLRKALDRLEDDVRDNQRQTKLASDAAITQLNIGPGEEQVIKFAGENWRIVRRVDGLAIIPLSVDEDI